jgi:CDP-diacylglycerol--glycerol-3-phosphate 3-phosphatidyltransferase
VSYEKLLRETESTLLSTFQFLGIDCSGGIAERTERLIIALTAIGFEGLGIPYALAIGVWSLFALAAVTVVQRILIVKAAL